MNNSGMLVLAQAKPGKEEDVEKFLKSLRLLIRQEVTAFYAFKLDSGQYGVFETFKDEEARQAHLAGRAVDKVFAEAVELFGSIPKGEKVEILIEKT